LAVTEIYLIELLCVRIKWVSETFLFKQFDTLCIEQKLRHVLKKLAFFLVIVPYYESLVLFKQS